MARTDGVRWIRSSGLDNLKGGLKMKLWPFVLTLLASGLVWAIFAYVVNCVVYPEPKA